MSSNAFVSRILPRLVLYRLQHLGLNIPLRPITLTHSVTFACQSRCKTCNIGHQYREHPELAKDDLTLEEIGKIYRSIGPIYFFNISGGEPFLRKDIPQIIELAMEHLTPRIVHSPTNAILSTRIRDKTVEALEIINRYDPSVQFTIKPSIDGVGEKHDEIRGIKGNFKQLLKTIELLKEVEHQYENFHLELGTVVSNFNINHLSEVRDFVHSLGVQSYRNEIAECREEFFNIDEEITPSAEVYERLMEEFKAAIRENIHAKKSLAKTTEALRLVYYDLVPRILREKRQVIPCYGGRSNIHLNYNGEAWPCCVLGYAHSLGNFRDEAVDYDYTSLMRSAKAKETLKYIKDRNCYCPLANQSYSNILLSPANLLKTIYTMFKLRRSAR
jgi:MoaA/NifB/PqqE/SkfB family radical SAM enzyme